MAILPVVETKKKTLGIYVHIPFCRSNCEYCDFYSIGGARNKDLMERYLDATVAHIRETAPAAPGYEVDTVYFGGGTPSFFGARGLSRLFAEIDRRFNVSRDAEVTFEANPDSVTLPMLMSLRRAGFNRISIGVQSDLDEQLKALGRPHNYKQAQQAVSLARRAGFDNVSVDLMFGLPNQSREQWMQTLRHVIDLKADHISCYGLKVEPGTKLYEYQNCANLPDDDAQADMYFYAVETLESFGYKQYEISNFAKDGYICRHNMKYWVGDEYLGFGPCAASDFAGKRFTIEADLEKYITGVMNKGVILSECETVPLRERAGEYLMLRLRTVDGVEEGEYTRSFLLPFKPIEKVLLDLQKQDLTVLSNGRWRLTPKGFMVSNSILVRLLDEQQRSKPLAQKR
ncbi:MAG: radical SAM family heme chaperone HemW [Clostridiales bacterium]|nr:radical SAM family heme chaperone HemW [Clostridiales bacterium]